jgi:lysozyme family protein
MCADFSRAIPFVLRHEGGYVNDPSDSGGETNFGISKASYPDLDIANLTVEQATAIYASDYWNGYGEIDDQLLATKVFDMAVNAGPGTSIKCLQRACNAMGASLTVDGGMGPNTVYAANRMNPSLLVPEFIKACVDHYTAIVGVHPEDAKFLNGWLARAQDVAI